MIAYIHDVDRSCPPTHATTFPGMTNAGAWDRGKTGTAAPSGSGGFGEGRGSLMALGLRTSSGTGVHRLGAALAAAFLCGAGPAWGAGPGQIDFARAIRPILAENCYECHGPD